MYSVSGFGFVFDLGSLDLPPRHSPGSARLPSCRRMGFPTPPSRSPVSLKFIAPSLNIPFHPSSVSSRTTMASADPCKHLPPPLSAGSSWPVHRSPRVSRTCLHAYARRIYSRAFRTGIGLQRYMPPHPTRLPLCASCSSSQRFACGFLHPTFHKVKLAVRLTLPPVGCVTNFHRQAGAPCRAHT